MQTRRLHLESRSLSSLGNRGVYRADDATEADRPRKRAACDYPSFIVILVLVLVNEAHDYYENEKKNVPFDFVANTNELRNHAHLYLGPHNYGIS